MINVLFLFSSFRYFEQAGSGLTVKDIRVWNKNVLAEKSTCRHPLFPVL